MSNKTHLLLLVLFGVNAHVVQASSTFRSELDSFVDPISFIEHMVAPHQDKCLKHKKVDRCVHSMVEDQLSTEKHEQQVTKVEHALIKDLFRTIEFKNEEKKLTVYKNNKRPRLEKSSLESYLKTKKYFENKRLQNYGVVSPTKDVLKALRKLYYRHVKHLGRVSSEDFLYLHYDRLKINTISAVIVSTVKIITTQEATITLYDRPLSQLLDEQNAVRDELDTLGTQIETLELSEVESPELAELNQKQKELQDKFLELTNKINDPESQLALSAADIRNLASNYFLREILLLNNKPSFKQNPVNKGDVLIAGFVSGAFSQDYLDELLKHESFKEERHVAIRQIGNIVYSVAKVMLMTNPYTTVPYILATVMMDSVKRRKEYEKEHASQTNLIR
jgi:hypothetical protein